MENQRKEAGAVAPVQEKKNNTSMVVGAAAVGVPKADPNMESAKIANRLSYQPTSIEQYTYTPMSQPVKQPAAQQSVKPTTIQEPKPVTFSNIGTSNYLLSDNLKKAGESMKSTQQNRTTAAAPLTNYLGLSDNLRKAGDRMVETVNTGLFTNGALGNTVVKNLRSNGQPELSDSMKGLFDAMERERYIAGLRENRAEERWISVPGNASAYRGAANPSCD